MSESARYQVVFGPGEAGIRFLLDQPEVSESSRKIEVDVIYTTEAGTLRAMELASALAKGLGAYVHLLFIYPVHYRLPLTEPAVSLPFLQAKMVRITKEFPGDALVHILLCREPFRAIEKLLPRSSLIVIGGQKRWWRTREQRLESQLERIGHQVIFAGVR